MMSGGDPNSGVQVEGQEIISLQEILEAFGAPLNEEQAWALCYQCGKYVIENSGRNDIGLVEGARGVLLSRDGNVCLAGAVPGSTDNARGTEHVLVNAIGRIIYLALDYGLSEEEERELSHPLEELIDFMTAEEEEDAEDENRNGNNNVGGRNGGLDNVDEGIVDVQEWDDDEEEEEEEKERSRVVDGIQMDSAAKVVDSEREQENNASQRMTNLLKRCSCHLPQPSEAASHYQAVCRAVYAEYQELATFLNKISGSKEILRSLSDQYDDTGGHVEDLQPREWAKIWLNVVRDLRNGVKLKKLDEWEKQRAPIEFALTPYEMLMDDIRSRRYTLNKVMVDGKIPPRLKKEAHDIVLDFIRSRPPLRPVPRDNPRSAPIRVPSIHERLMDEIRSKPALKPAPIVHNSNIKCAPFVFNNIDLDSPQLPRKVLKAEFTLDWSEEESEGETSRNHESDFYSRPAYQEEVEEGEEEDGADILERAIQKIIDDGQKMDQTTMFLDISRTQDTIPSTPEKTLTMSRSSLSSFDEIASEDVPKDSVRRHSIGPCQSFQTKTKSPKDMECLSLTVEEVIHIRSVLVKAEIENLRVNQKLYRAVLQDKVCFSCKKKFTFFQKKLRCRLCKKLICGVCCVKMYIPKEEFLHIPVESLSPSSPKMSPSSPLRQRSISDPPTPFLLASTQQNRQQDLHVWRKPTPVENVCCECCTFLKNTRMGPPPTAGVQDYPTPFNLSKAPLHKMQSFSNS
ncbi:protein spire homolog 1-like [Diadema setosum]|uniref:protein spire homolog 1-like n=1 Tax=Diadema setosum TaxID=31175 RepID=UPI003B3B78A0